MSVNDVSIVGRTCIDIELGGVPWCVDIGLIEVTHGLFQRVVEDVLRLGAHEVFAIYASRALDPTNSRRHAPRRCDLVPPLI